VRSGWYYSSILTYAVQEEVTRHWRKLQNEELHYLNPSNIVRVIKPRRNKWARHVLYMNSGTEMSTGFF